jgi:hypothetical protein
MTDHASIQERLNKVIDAYRALAAAARDREQTTQALGRLICNVGADELPVYDAVQRRSLDHWTKQLDEIDAENSQSTGGSGGGSGSGSGGAGGGGGDGPGGNGGNGGNGGGGRRDADKDSDDDEDGQGSILGKVDTSLYAWRNQPAPAFLHIPSPLAVLVNNRRANYLKKLSHAIKDMEASLWRPAIPGSLYETLFRNDYMDLSKIRAKQLDPLARRTVELGNSVNLELGALEPSSPLSDLGDLVLASQAYIEALGPVYPELAGPARAWFQHVQAMFQGMGSAQSLNILAWDAAFRLELAKCPWFTFADHANAHFDAIRIRYLTRPLQPSDIPPAVRPAVALGDLSQRVGQAGPIRSGAARKESRELQICGRYNSPGGCRQRPGQRPCVFAHICNRSGCFGGHPRTECSK